MKIGTFAAQFGISINTVRYYVNTGLLLPESINKQHRFNEHNAEDMRLILRLKKFGFTIGQIHDILSLIRISNLAVGEDVQDYIHILEQQHDALQHELDCMQQTIGELDAYINSMRSIKTNKNAQPRRTGVPIEFMPILCYPHCQTTLNFADTTIENGQILSARLSCNCGYWASIIDGILVTDGRNISQYDSPDLDRKFYKDLPASWVSLFQRSYNWIFGHMRTIDLKGKIVMENHINCYFFLYAMLGRLDHNALYIISDKYPEMVALYKELIESQDMDLKILYLSDSTFDYPLKHGSVDVYIDYCSINEYSIFETENDLIDVMHPYLKPNANILGTYFYFDSGSASHHKLIAEYPTCLRKNYLLHHFMEIVRREELKLIASENIGYVSDEGSKNRNFSFHVAGDKLYLQSYHYRR